MKFALIALLSFMVQTIDAEPIKLKDALGRTLVLDQPAERIVSLSPATTELLFELGAGPQVIATTSGSDYPEKATKLPIVAAPGQVNIEAIVALKPDLVVFWSDGLSTAKAAKLDAFGIPWFAIAPRGLDEVAHLINTLGLMSGHQAESNQLSQRFLRDIADIQDEYKGKQSVRYFYQVSARPLFTLNGQHMLSQALEYCGGENIFADLSVLAPRVGLEAVLEADPEVILISPGLSRQLPGYWAKWPFLRAVADNQIVTLEDDSLQRPTMRLLKGMKSACLALNRARSIDKTG